MYVYYIYCIGHGVIAIYFIDIDIIVTRFLKKIQ